MTHDPRRLNVRNKNGSCFRFVRLDGEFKLGRVENLKPFIVMVDLKYDKI